ncbi:AAA family ATPase [Calidifontibacter sp. DB0510]|uniref:AAA family ATPase n=1 Tax=Metallococcus carri TaxID=1656884 RepID=A0A967B1J9_9MICO|nr:AAA family ATPase [Metallococcus carri]NHN55600.1 AAA family ATPase [Metallococcus carri]NOP38216.1 AAA family ATPase [Calidifontibacter sp. DB2511S]
MPATTAPDAAGSTAAGSTAAPSNNPPDLAAEQAYLARARAELARMRTAAASLDASRASDADSVGVLTAVLAARVAALQDDPSTTLFFGRIDTTDAERWYLGRRHIGDSDGNPVVIDWRAPVSTAFYRASHAEPMGVTLRRRFGVDHGQLTAIEDEHLQDPAEPETASGVLAAEIERPRTGPMRDIVATIQPEQDEIVRSDVGLTVCVQGAPGTGKTAVGLHRAAWLLYAFKQRLERAGVLVVGPNQAFLDHITAVLPALGEVRVRHTTAAELLTSVPVRAEDNTAAATLKGDARMATVVERAVWSHVAAPTEALVVPRGVRKWRVPAYDVAEVLARLRERGVRYLSGRAMCADRLAHEVLLKLERAGESPDDRVQDAVARSAPVKAYLKQLWPVIDARQVLFELWSSPSHLAACADGVLTSDEQRILLWDKPVRSKGSARWTTADAVLLDEIDDLLERRPSLGHVVLDEAQDLSPMQLRGVGRRCSTGSATVLGDIAQGTTPWATSSWEETMRHLGKPDHHLEVLDRGFRVPAAVIEYAARLLPAMAPGLGAPVSVRTARGALDVRSVDDLGSAAGEVVDTRGAGSFGVIGIPSDLDVVAKVLRDKGIAFGRVDSSHGDDEDHPVQLVPASIAKGLEFDEVLVLEPAAIAAAEPDERTGLRRLYVVLTRAVSALTVLHTQPLPAALHPQAADRDLRG